VPASTLSFSCAAASAPLYLHKLRARQHLNELDEIEVELLSSSSAVQPGDLLGKPASVQLTTPKNTQRWFNGLVTRFGLGVEQSSYFSYRATLRPWLWLLTLTRDCRVFQNKTVREIVEAVFNAHGAVADWEFSLLRTEYAAREYCVQYHETDFEFVARLLQEEGIYWYFEHGAQGHKLMLVDELGDPSNPASGYDTVSYVAVPKDALPPPGEWVTQWSFGQAMHTGQVTVRGYDFTRPAQQIGDSSATPPDAVQTPGEEYDYLSQYVDSRRAERTTDDRVEALRAGFERIEGQGNVWGLMTGRVFSLSGHPRTDQNAQVLCLGTLIEATLEGYASASPGNAFACRFWAMPSGTPYRPPPARPKPRMAGPQTAVVVGSGEIETDSYGRVKVRFHWERLNSRDGPNVCWVRVSSPWAGNGFGFIQVPRVGDEVVVDFLEGDPDQPLITGRVYNAARMPPWALPGNASQSGFVTRSTPGGDATMANVLRFEDKKDQEQVWLHAQRDQLIEVEHDETHTVGNDRQQTVEHHEKQVVKGRRWQAIGAAPPANMVSETPGGQVETVLVTGNRGQSVSGSDVLAVSGHATRTVSGTVTENVTGRYYLNAQDVVDIYAPKKITIDSRDEVVVNTPHATNDLRWQWTTSGFSGSAVGMSLGFSLMNIASTGISVATAGFGFSYQTIGLALTNIALARNGVKLESTSFDASDSSATFKKSNLFMIA
jgi:type VI secretion system secreted protein VgrG